MNDLITMTEAAKKLDCSRQWIHYLIKQGRLKAQKVGKAYILRERDVLACKVRPRSKPEENGHMSAPKRGKKKGKK